jgi:hypothetical protein
MVFQLIDKRRLAPLGADLSSVALGPNGLNNVDINSTLHQPFLQHGKRDTQPKCSPRTYTAAQKRDFGVGEQDFNVTLYRRVMTLPDGTDASAMDTFMTAEMESSLFDSIIWEKEIYGEEEDMATATFEEFGDEALSLGTGFLCGCTTLVIVSRLGVYIGHYWENISFDPDADWLEVYGTAERAFQQTVIKGLTQGIRPNARIPEQVSLKNQAKYIADNYIRAYLMIPDADANGNPDGYRPQWNAMKGTVNKFVPTLATGDRWREVTYTPLRNKDPKLDTTAQGRLLFKYDPDQRGKRKATLWIERQAKPYHDDEW